MTRGDKVSQSDRMDLEKDLNVIFDSKWRGQDLKRELVDLCKSAINFERQRMIEKFRPIIEGLQKFESLRDNSHAAVGIKTFASLATDLFHELNRDGNKSMNQADREKAH